MDELDIYHDSEDLERGSELVELNLVLVHETDAAILVWGVGRRYAWLPKSLTEVARMESPGADTLVSVAMPEWLAIEKELV